MREDLDSIETSVQSDRVTATTPQATAALRSCWECHTMAVCAMSDWCGTQLVVDTLEHLNQTLGQVAEAWASATPEVQLEDVEVRLRAVEMVAEASDAFRGARNRFREIMVGCGWFSVRRKVELESAGASEGAEARFGEEEGDRTIGKIQPAAECQSGDASPTGRPKLEASAVASRGQTNRGGPTWGCSFRSWGTLPESDRTQGLS